MQYLYLWVDFLVIIIPFLGSFESRVRYYRRWPAIFGSLLLVLVPFILWDILFTELKVWHFNDQYSGWTTLMGLPLAEWLFFICIPYACVYIYDWVAFFRNKWRIEESFSKKLYVFHAITGIFCLIVAFWFHEKMYTSIVFGLSGILLLMVNVLRPWYMYRFWISYFVVLIPFFIVNGYLTAKPIVLYNNQENLGIRLFTIPLEDLFYTLLLLLPIVMIYEKMTNKQGHR